MSSNISNDIKEKYIKLCPNNEEVGSYKLANDIYGFLPIQCEKEDGTKVGENDSAAIKIKKESIIVIPDCTKRSMYHPFAILKKESCLKYRTNEAYVCKLFTKQYAEYVKCYSKYNPNILCKEGSILNSELDHNNLKPNKDENIKGISFF